MLRSFASNAAQNALAVGFSLTIGAGPLHAAESDSEIGVVLASSGTPVLQDTSGRATPSSVMATIRADDIIRFGVGDRVTICNEVLGSTVEIDGPGTVRLTRSEVVRVTGSPGVRIAGPCEASASGNTDGGVLLRRLTHNQPPR